jgi:hypothetical protein
VWFAAATKPQEKVLKQKEKEQKHTEFIESCTAADVLVDEANAKSLKGCSDTALLQSIKGVWCLKGKNDKRRGKKSSNNGLMIPFILFSQRTVNQEEQ